eukprot:3042183-Amphidinium_carterae.1
MQSRQKSQVVIDGDRLGLLNWPSCLLRPVTLKLASHDWLSHELLAKVGQLVLEEGLGYTVELVRHTNPANWGPDIAAGLYDMDGENWHADPS